MGRQKGSLNRSTMERILRDRGVTNFEGLDNTQLQYKIAHPEVIPAVTIRLSTPVKPPVCITPEQAQTIIDDARRRLHLMVAHYTWPRDQEKAGERAFIPERIQEYLRTKVCSSTSTQEAIEYAKKALSKLEIHLMGLWCHKYISGPADAKNIAKIAKQAEAWAKKLESDGKDATKQWQKVAEIRATPIRGVGSPWTY